MPLWRNPGTGEIRAAVNRPGPFWLIVDDCEAADDGSPGVLRLAAMVVAEEALASFASDPSSSTDTFSGGGGDFGGGGASSDW